MVIDLAMAAVIGQAVREAAEKERLAILRRIRYMYGRADMGTISGWAIVTDIESWLTKRQEDYKKSKRKSIKSRLIK